LRTDSIATKNKLLSLPGYQMSAEVGNCLAEAANTVRPFADSSWLPWAKNLLPELETQRLKEDARQEREKRKLELYTANKISVEEFMASSDEEDVMVIDDPPAVTKPTADIPSRSVEITDLSSGSTVINAKAKGDAKGSGKGEAKGKARAKGKEKEKSVERPIREPPRIPKNASLVRPFSTSTWLS
jgi:hypothetical protein